MTLRKPMKIDGAKYLDPITAIWDPGCAEVSTPYCTVELRSYYQGPPVSITLDHLPFDGNIDTITCSSEQMGLMDRVILLPNVIVRTDMALKDVPYVQLHQGIDYHYCKITFAIPFTTDTTATHSDDIKYSRYSEYGQNAISSEEMLNDIAIKMDGLEAKFTTFPMTISLGPPSPTLPSPFPPPNNDCQTAMNYNCTVIFSVPWDPINPGNYIRSFEIYIEGASQNYNIQEGGYYSQTTNIAFAKVSFVAFEYGNGNGVAWKVTIDPVGRYDESFYENATDNLGNSLSAQIILTFRKEINPAGTTALSYVTSFFQPTGFPVFHDDCANLSSVYCTLEIEIVDPTVKYQLFSLARMKNTADSHKAVNIVGIISYDTMKPIPASTRPAMTIGVGPTAVPLPNNVPFIDFGVVFPDNPTGPWSGAAKLVFIKQYELSLSLNLEVFNYFGEPYHFVYGQIPYKLNTQFALDGVPSWKNDCETHTSPICTGEYYIHTKRIPPKPWVIVRHMLDIGSVDSIDQVNSKCENVKGDETFTFTLYNMDENYSFPSVAISNENEDVILMRDDEDEPIKCTIVFNLNNSISPILHRRIVPYINHNQSIPQIRQTRSFGDQYKFTLPRMMWSPLQGKPQKDCFTASSKLQKCTLQATFYGSTTAHVQTLYRALPAALLPQHSLIPTGLYNMYTKPLTREEALKDDTKVVVATVQTGPPGDDPNIRAIDIKVDQNYWSKTFLGYLTIINPASPVTMIVPQVSIGVDLNGEDLPIKSFFVLPPMITGSIVTIRANQTLFQTPGVALLGLTFHMADIRSFEMDVDFGYELKTQYPCIEIANDLSAASAISRIPYDRWLEISKSSDKAEKIALIQAEMRKMGVVGEPVMGWVETSIDDNNDGATVKIPGSPSISNVGQHHVTFTTNPSLIPTTTNQLGVYGRTCMIYIPVNRVYPVLPPSGEVEHTTTIGWFGNPPQLPMVDYSSQPFYFNANYPRFVRSANIEGVDTPVASQDDNIGPGKPSSDAIKVRFDITLFFSTLIIFMMTF